MSHETTEKINKDHEQWITIKQFCQSHPWPSESGMRAYMHRANDLGIADAFARIGRRVLVSPKRFFSLITQTG